MVLEGMEGEEDVMVGVVDAVDVVDVVNAGLVAGSVASGLGAGVNSVAAVADVGGAGDGERMVVPTSRLLVAGDLEAGGVMAHGVHCSWIWEVLVQDFHSYLVPVELLEIEWEYRENSIHH